MAYREPPADGQATISEPEAYVLACRACGFALAREPRNFRWGWVYDPAPPVAAGPGPISVTVRGDTISHGSLPCSFTHDEEPIDRHAIMRARRSWWRRWLF